MPTNKKKNPGRPKKEFISKKPKIAPKSGPGRPRKDTNSSTITHKEQLIGTEFIHKSVDDSKKKDMIILILFFLSFILFVVSLYVTFIKNKKVEVSIPSDISEIANIETGNIEYGTSTGSAIIIENTATGEISQPTPIQGSVQNISPEQQTIVDFYQAINVVDISTIYVLTDARLEESNVFKTYYNKAWLSKFSDTLLAPKIVLTNIQEVATTTENPNIKNFSYTVEYVLANNQQKFTEERSTVLIKKGDNWRIGKLLCETKGCSSMPFFNPDKYK